MATPVGPPPGFVLDERPGMDPNTLAPSAHGQTLPEGFEIDPPEGGSVLLDAGEDAIRGVNKGAVSLLTMPYEAVRYLLDQGVSIPGIGSARPGFKIPPAAEMPLYKPFLQQPEPTTGLGKYTQAAGEAVGASVVPAAGLMRAASKLPQVAPAVPALADRLLRPIAQNPGLATGLDVAAGTGSGIAKQATEEAGGGPTAQTTASILGGMATPAAVVTAGQGARRAGSAAFEMLPKILASADGAIPPNVARERAVQMIADQLTKAGVSPDEIERRIANIDWSRVFHTSGQAQDAMTLADLDESLARLLGSAVRQQPEAANTARGFLRARQTGLPPEQPLHPGAGIPTRRDMDLPITGKESTERFGTDFRAGQDNLVPVGTHERFIDTLKRAFRISDTDHHGHAANANRTDDQLIESGKALSKPAYDAAHRAGYGVDLQPHLAKVLSDWKIIAAADGNEPLEVQKFLNAMLRRFGSVRNIQQFDKNKQFALDAKIESLLKSIEGRNHYFAGRLIELKGDLLAAVDGITTNNLGPLYKAARDIFSSHADARRVLKLGRDSFSDDADVGVDAFKALTSRGDQKLYRLGYLGAVEKKSANMPHGADRTKLFDNPRQQGILRNIIERSADDDATFADRPQRFGGYLADEGRMIRTRDTVSGNSKTAERSADDLAFDTLHNVLDIFKDPRLLSIGKRALELSFNKAFGMRADTSAELAQLLLTAAPGQRQDILRAIQARMGSTRFQRFTEIMQEYQRQSVTGTVGGAAASVSGDR